MNWIRSFDDVRRTLADLDISDIDALRSAGARVRSAIPAAARSSFRLFAKARRCYASLFTDRAIVSTSASARS
jgi:phosphoenolpyruvate synthase/pyruvate phosphate dikinase